MGIDKWNGREVLLEIENIAGKKLLKIGFAIERDAKRIVAVDTGRLKNSISTSQKEKLKVIVGTNVEYAPHIELGTGKRAARPFLRPALAGTLAFLQSEFNKPEKL